ncbi:hypothetical protein ACIBG4_41630 [Nonomuraea sp. NPDC050383]|uniref:hypothetical protein n=1 Tax=Nonomuraea sp. NPDC050383 TaxID=3364362 RepID=UPI0037BCFE4C
MSHPSPPGDRPYEPHPPYEPYGQHPPYEPYGGPYGQQPPPGYGPGPYYGPPPPRSGGVNAAALVALILNLLSIVSCCNILAIPGSILAGLALRADTPPHRARGMLAWSWTLFGLGFVLAVGVFVLLGVNGYLDD